MINQSRVARKDASDQQKYLIVESGDKRAGICITSVRRIIEFEEPLFIAGMPDYCLGVLNLQGESIPVVDLQQRLGLGAATIQSRSSIVITQLAQESAVAQIGLVVDAVSHVAMVELSSMHEVPELARQDPCNIAISPEEGAVILDPAKILLQSGAEPAKPDMLEQSEDALKSAEG